MRRWREMRQKDRVAVAVIWVLVIAGAFLLGLGSDDPGGAGQLAAVVGVALTFLYLRIRWWLW
jgi:multisubunit Na+/H+ antiporter MnhB subunit